MREAPQEETPPRAEGPLDFDGATASSDLLAALLKIPLGRVTFAESDLFVSDQGKRAGRQLFHNGKYFHKRLADYPDRPINGKCQERVLAMYREILAGRMPRYDAQTVAARLIGVLEKASGLPMDALAARCAEGDKAARSVLLELLGALLSLALDAEAVTTSAVRCKFENALGRGASSAALSGGHGVSAFFRSVAEVDYPRRISGVSSRLDIAHFHGLTWTNFHREYLRAALEKPDVEARVTLLDPASRFFEPYADFIRVDARTLEAKYEEVVNIWKTVHADAAAKGQKAASLKLYANQGFPAKSIYRFDDEIVVTPANNAQPKAQFVAYACRKATDPSEEIFDVYEKELDWLFGAGARLIWSSEG